MNRQKRQRPFRPARVVALSFGAIILAGTLLLMLPWAARSGESAGALTALFTAASATCVTGLSVADTWLTWSLFGQAVILAMIQLGGLGFVSVMTLVLRALDRRCTLSQRLLLASSLNLDGPGGVTQVMAGAWKLTFLLEGVGAAALSACFIPQYGWAGGIWRGVFHAVSAFCNAGFDILGGDSLAAYSADPAVLGILMALTVAGGLGFFVWEDLRRHRRWKKLSLYTRLLLLGTAALLFVGWLGVLAGEWNNPDTLGAMPVWQKLLNGLFQSVTLRTAGFSSFDQGARGPGTLLLSILLMLVGGGGGSTAGGIKVGTLWVLLLALRAGLTGRDTVTVRRRAVSSRQVLNALTLLFSVGILFLAGTAALALVDGVSLQAAAFEVMSAVGTVGLSTGITSCLSLSSKLILIALMFLGRVGILSFSMAFLIRGRQSRKIEYPPAHIMVG